MASGIYKISSIKFPEKIYIGSAIDLIKRWKLHIYKLKSKNHHSPILQCHVNKYGLDDLHFVIIEECDKSILLKREQYYLDKLNPVLNTCKVAGNHTGRKCTPESIERIRIAKRNISEETRQKMRIAAKKRGWINKPKMTEEIKEKIRQKAIGNKRNLGHKRSEATKLKMSISMRGKNRNNKNMLGHKHTDESKLKMSISLKGKTPWNKGKHFSELSRKRMSQARLGIKHSEKHKTNISKGVRLAMEKKRKTI